MRFNLTIIVLLILGITQASSVIACDNAVCNKNNSSAALIRQVSEEDAKWAADLRSSSIDMMWQNLKSKFESQEQLEIKTDFKSNSDEERERQFAGLYIFVSTSMPKPLLKSYLQRVQWKNTQKCRFTFLKVFLQERKELFSGAFLVLFTKDYNISSPKIFIKRGF